MVAPQASVLQLVWNRNPSPSQLITTWEVTLSNKVTNVLKRVVNLFGGRTHKRTSNGRTLEHMLGTKPGNKSLPINAVDPCICPVSRLFGGHYRGLDHIPARSPVAAANAHASGRCADEGATPNQKHCADGLGRNRHACRPFGRHSSGSEVVMVCGCHRVRDATRPDEDGAAEMVTGCRRADDGENPAEGGAVEMVNDGGGREAHPSSQRRNRNRKR